MTLTPYLLSQILATVALFTDLASFQFKEKSKIMTCTTISTVFLAVHCYLLNEISASIILIIAALRFYTAIFTTNSTIRNLFVLVSLIAVCFTYDGFVSLLPAVASINSTYACFLKNDQPLRLRMIVTTTLFIVFYIIIRSPVAVLMETGFVVSNMVGYLRYYGLTMPKNWA